MQGLKRAAVCIAIAFVALSLEGCVEKDSAQNSELEKFCNMVIEPQLEGLKNKALGLLTQKCVKDNCLISTKDSCKNLECIEGGKEQMELVTSKLIDSAVASCVESGKDNPSVEVGAGNYISEHGAELKKLTDQTHANVIAEAVASTEGKVENVADVDDELKKADEKAYFEEYQIRKKYHAGRGPAASYISLGVLGGILACFSLFAAAVGISFYGAHRRAKATAAATMAHGEAEELVEAGESLVE